MENEVKTDVSSWNELLKGKVALVTGASRGLGRADALALAEAGADVVITDILIESDENVKEEAKRIGPLAQVMESTKVVYAEKTAKEIQAMGRRSFAVKMDVTNREQVQDVVKRVVEEFGRIDILVIKQKVLITLLFLIIFVQTSSCSTDPNGLLIFINGINSVVT